MQETPSRFIVKAPDSLSGATIVDANWVKTNFAKVKIYDSRKKGEYVEKHLPGAINAPYKEKSAKAVDFDASKDRWDISKYPADKNAKIVVYCNGVRCWKSYKTIVRLLEAGYKNLYWFREGFPGWTAKGYPTE